MDDSSIIIPNTSDDTNTSILNLEAKLHKQSENCEKMSLSIKQGEVDLKQKDEEIVHQQNKVYQLNLTVLALRFRFCLFTNNMQNVWKIYHNIWFKSIIIKKST